MKRIYVAAILLMLAFSFSAIEVVYINNCYEKYTGMLNECEDYYSNKEYSNAAKKCEATLMKLKKDEGFLNVFLSQNKVDNIAYNMELLKINAQNKDEEKFETQIDKIKRQLLSLKKSELPCFENIL